MSKDLVVVIGVGGMGQAIARTGTDLLVDGGFVAAVRVSARPA